MSVTRFLPFKVDIYVYTYVKENLFPTIGFSGNPDSLSRDILDTDFLGGKAGRLTSSTAGASLGSFPVTAPFTELSAGRPIDVRVGRGGGTDEVLSCGLEIKTLLRLGGRAGDISPLERNVK